MKRISPERKSAILVKLLPPYNMSVSTVAQMEGIAEATLYNWRNQAKQEGETRARRRVACREVNLSLRTWQRWQKHHEDGRLTVVRPVSVNRLSPEKEHRHSGICYVTPAERHRGEDRALLKQRDELYRQAQKAHPERGSGKTRNWQPEGPVTLNPEQEKQAV